MTISTDLSPAMLSWSRPSNLDSAISRVSNCIAINGMKSLIGVTFSSIEQFSKAIRESMFEIKYKEIMTSNLAITYTIEIKDPKEQIDWVLYANTFKAPYDDFDQFLLILNCSKMTQLGPN